MDETSKDDGSDKREKSSEEDSEQLLRDKLSEAGEEIVYFRYDDYNFDGEYEAFARSRERWKNLTFGI